MKDWKLNRAKTLLYGYINAAEHVSEVLNKVQEGKMTVQEASSDFSWWKNLGAREPIIHQFYDMGLEALKDESDQ